LLVAQLGQLGYVGIDLGLKRGGQHATSPLTHDLINQGTGLGGTIFSDYAEHGRTFPDPHANAGHYSETCRSSGRVRPSHTPKTDPQLLSIALIHDSHLFDGVDDRQLAAAFNLARETAHEEGMQYIATLNTDDLRKAEDRGFEPGEAVIAPRLTDADPRGGLFGFRF
jgi:hypothetical protein